MKFKKGLVCILTLTGIFSFNLRGFAMELETPVSTPSVEKEKIIQSENQLPEEQVSQVENPTQSTILELDPLSPRAILTRAAPPVPGDTEVLSEVFRAPIGNSPQLISDKILQMTGEVKSQFGAIWSKDKLDLKRDFSLKAYLYLGNSKADAADGITFTLQNDQRMLTDAGSVIGDTGMGIGVYSNKAGGNYVRNAISIEFDTYYNDGTSNRMDKEVGANSKRGHIAIVTPKASNNNYSGEHSAVTLAPVYLSNGQWREIEFEWKAATQVLSYDVKGIGSKSHHIPNLNTQFGGTEVYWGFTASTGRFFAENVIAISELPQKIIQEATVENKTTATGPKTSIEAVKNDLVELKTTIKTSAFVKTSDYVGSSIKANISEGITPDLDNLRVNGVVVERNSVEQVGETLFIHGITLAESGENEIIIPAQVTSEKSDVVLEAEFSLISSLGKQLSISNKVLVEIPKIQMGELVIKYVDEKDRPIRPEESIWGEIDTTYEETYPEIPGYKYLKTIGNAKGEFTDTAQTLIFQYETAAFTLKQSVTKLDGSQADDVITSDSLRYTLELESFFTADASEVKYQTLKLTEKLPVQLDKITDLQLRTSAEKSVGTVTYDQTNHSVIAEVSLSDDLARDENLILTFTSSIKPETLGETLIKVKGQGEAVYTDSMLSGEITSNEVSSNVLGRIILANAPRLIDFGTVSITDFQKKVSADKQDISSPLVVEDNRRDKKEWQITAQVEKEMTNGDDVQTGAFKYVLNQKELTLDGSTQVIYANEGNSETFSFNISDSWGKGDLSEGLKLKLDSNKVPKTTGNYEGRIRWTLRDTIE